MFLLVAQLLIMHALFVLFNTLLLFFFLLQVLLFPILSESENFLVMFLAAAFVPLAFEALSILKNESSVTVHHMPIFGATSVLQPVVVFCVDYAIMEHNFSILIELDRTNNLILSTIIGNFY